MNHLGQARLENCGAGREELILHVVKRAWLFGILGSVAASLAAPLPAGAAPPVVVIDAGHGGSNTGARGAGLVEKQVTLAIATRVAELLRARDVTVQLTRTDDRTLTLRQRAAAAAAAAADVLVSIHANASTTRTQRGYETFVLTPRAVDVDGRALRGELTTPRPGVDPEIAAVLDDVERGASQWEAADLAARMQRALRDRRGPDGDRGVRQDAHHVLLGATMPAVLVEVGFLDHPIEGRELASPAVRAQLADAIAEAIGDQLAQ